MQQSYILTRKSTAVMRTFNAYELYSYPYKLDPNIVRKQLWLNRPKFIYTPPLLQVYQLLWDLGGVGWRTALKTIQHHR